MFFAGWEPIGRIPATACAAYFGLLLILRLTGKRTLAQLNAFDLVVTVALGSILSSTILDDTTPVAEGLAALAALALLQCAVAWISTRSRRAAALIKSEPRLVFHRGRFLEEALRRERLGQEDVLQVLRGQGTTSLETVTAVVLESNGKFSVLRGKEGGPMGSLANVAGPSGSMGSRA